VVLLLDIGRHAYQRAIGEKAIRGMTPAARIEQIDSPRSSRRRRRVRLSPRSRRRTRAPRCWCSSATAALPGDRAVLRLYPGGVHALPARRRRRGSPNAWRPISRKKNHGEADPAVVRAVCEESGPAIEWLADRHAVPFQLLEGFLYPGHSALRMHCVPEKTGSALMACLLNACHDIDILTSAHVRDVTAKEIQFERPNGQTETVEYGALVLACSGFGGNPPMVKQHLPEIADALYFGHTGNQGDAVRWGQALGAATAHMSAYQGHGSVAVPQNVLDHLGADGGRRHPGERGGSALLQRAPRLLRAVPAGAAPARRRRLVHLRRAPAPARHDVSDYRDAEAAGAVKASPDFAGPFKDAFRSR